MFIFAWKNVDTFRRHMEEMESFRRAHELPTPGKPDNRASKAQQSLHGNPVYPVQPVNGFTENGQKIVVPIWYISMPKGSQN